MSELAAMALPTLTSQAHQDQARAARARGFAEGFAEGKQAAARQAESQRVAEREAHQLATARAEEQLAHALEVLADAAKALQERTVPPLHQAREVLTRSALELAESILGNELAHHGPHAARAALQRAMSVANDTIIVAVRLHPDDIGALPENVRSNTPVELVPDATLNPGDAISVFDVGFYDARIDAALQRARDELGQGGQQ